MSGIYVRYKPVLPSEEPWRAVELPKSAQLIDILALLRSDDSFTTIYPITKVFTVDARLKGGSAVGASSGGLAEVGSVHIDDLPSSSSFYVQRSGGVASDYSTVIPGPVKGPIVVKGRAHRLRSYDDHLDAFVKKDSIDVNGWASAVMIESVPLGVITPEVTKMFKYSNDVDTYAAFDVHHTSTGHLTEAGLLSEWSQSAVPTDREGMEAGKWKARIRKGVPSTFRHFVLPTLLERCASTGRQSLDEALRWTYGWPPPAGFLPDYYPSFGCQHLSGLHETVPLLPSGWLQHKFILTCLAQQQPDITVCPTLPAVISYLLLIFPPNEAFVLSSKLMQLSRRDTASTIRYLPLSTESTASFVASAVKIVLNTGVTKGTNLTPDLLTILFEDSAVAFFSQTLPHLYVLRIFDMYAFEGIKILIRIFVGILRVYLPRFGERDLTQFLIGGVSVSNSLYNTCTQSAFEHIVEEAFKLSLSKNDISWSGTSGEFIKSRKELYHWPKLVGGADGSAILGTNLQWYEKIYVNFPTSYVSIKRVFRASEESWALKNFYSKVNGETKGPAVILIQTDQGLRAGLFTSDMNWKPGKSYTGSNTDFIFSIDKESQLTIYPVTSESKNVLLLEKDFLTVGEGPAFRLTSDLQTAMSSSCSTFSSPQLWIDVASIIEVEVFSIE